MKKDELNQKLRVYVKDYITPTTADKDLVIKIYASIGALLGEANCIQIGSYPRFTAIRPLHDLDVLYVLGEWNEKEHSPAKALADLMDKIKREYENPTSFQINIPPAQTHSVSIEYLDKDIKVFSVDIVPAYKDGTNEFDLDKYRVPEIVKHKPTKRAEFYLEVKNTNKEMEWIKSDPRGYIKIAANVNVLNDDFRRSVKFLKAWKDYCKEENDDFKLKSFHIEQVITDYFNRDKNLTIFDAIFKFLYNLKFIISEPRIPDRANPNIFIDGYLNNDDFREDLVLQARDRAILWLENIDEEDIAGLFEESPFYKSPISESFVSRDRNIPVLISKDLIFKIDGKVEKMNGFRKFKGKLSGILFNIDYGNRVEYDVSEANFEYDYTLWKVRNDYEPEPRGEITKDHTKNYPERIAFLGDHYVEAYAIKSGICIAKDRITVQVVQSKKFYSKN